ncbi:DUF1624 domain-containing protein [Microbacterium rhizomatis]|uniref:DUF1624 domain-containing protein n=1 Tax=Microbacterium rhizomatis TaxID=1631477 RepID=A0A5J5J920_9MICO|nr:DUF1624 domain-containing protein [Microbacterium rhizomatis]
MPEAGWLATRWARLDGPERIAGIDLARGLAVLGMFAAHLLALPEVDLADPATWIGVADGRSSILFATIAGVSIGLLSGGARPARGAQLRVVRIRLVARAIFLWLLGVLLVVTGVPVYVILQAYAFLFVLSILLVPLSARVLLSLAAALALVMPFVQVWLDELPFWATAAGEEVAAALGWHYPFVTWIAFIAAGMGFARLGIRRGAVQVWMLVAGAALAAIGYGLDAVSGTDAASENLSYWNQLWTARAHSTGLLEVIGSGGFAIAVVGACLLLCRTVLRYPAVPLRAVGAMPLTAYTAQIVAWAIVAAAVLGDTGNLWGFRALEPFAPFAICTIVGCTAWALLVGRGPLEWVMDRFSRVLSTPVGPGR